VNLPLVVDGLLPVDKSVGPTSHQVVAEARRALGLRRIGHTGTLDPFASGLLLLCLGTSTRLAEYFDAFPKGYQARARLGESTDTEDREGQVIARSEGWRSLDPQVVADCLSAMVGDRWQRPPAYSAKRVEGRRAHELAREGELLELPAVPVRIHSIEVESIELPELTFRVRCSTGTYIRAIARELGELLGVGGHLRELRRTEIGPFRVEDALPQAALVHPDLPNRHRISPLDALRDRFPVVPLGAEELRRIELGQRILTRDPALPEGGLVLLADGERLSAVARRVGEGLHPEKVFHHA